ncbi:MAG: NAD(P)H-hydrate dehydratase [Gemmatimonadaceae bacterium]|nr:NAD(P)H-hydrate dehydratase [Gemmatimonadaceae bacterium]
MRSAVFVTTGAQSAARDRAAIAAGTPSFVLMQSAAAAAVDRIVAHGLHARGTVAVWVGPGNNGGDGWLIAAGLRAHGATVRIGVLEEPRTDDAQAARATACAGGAFDAADGTEAVHIDALFGTGQRAPLPPSAAHITRMINAARARGASTVAIDVPTGVAEREVPHARVQIDADAVIADCTLTFGTLKRVLLSVRESVGALEVLDIGLGTHATQDDGAPRWIDAAFVRSQVPRIPAHAHKGTRGRLAIIGGAPGMVGATILAARAALASGIGLVRVVCAGDHVGAVHAAVPEALVTPWPLSPDTFNATVGAWADAIVVGPGLGRSEAARALVAMCRATATPLLVDADAIAPFGDAPARTAPTLWTPHPGEALAMLDPEQRAALADARAIDAARDRVAPQLAMRSAGVVLLKGVPTIIAQHAATTTSQAYAAIVARGTAALAVGGSGDVLSGIGGTLLAQGCAPFDAAAIAAWVHGRAAEQATARRGGVRGTTLADILDALPDAWPRGDEELPPSVLATLPAIV